jgi:hypothetical protein
MKEINLFESWANGILEDSSRLGTPMTAKADRPLPREMDINYKAQRQYPELSPEQALAKYLEDELEKNEKIDRLQNKEINDIEDDEAKLQSQLSRLIDLVKAQ